MNDIVLVIVAVDVFPFQIGNTLETVASQNWVREKCSRNRNQLLDNDMLGDHTLSSNSQARYLLHLLNPYCSSETSADSPQVLARMDSSNAMQHILEVHSFGVSQF